MDCEQCEEVCYEFVCYKLLPGWVQISNEINVVGYVQLNRQIVR